MTPDLLREIGEALYGPLWQSELARTVRVADRTVQRWAAGQFRIPDAIRGELATVLRERQRRVKDLLGRL